MDNQSTNIPNAHQTESPPLFDKKKLIPLFIFVVIAVSIVAAFYAAKETILKPRPTPTPTIIISPIMTQSPTCIPRPACLDTTPRCLIPETPDMCPKNTPTPKLVVCTQDAKMCPDGSYVSRTEPKCEFTPCPTTTQGTFCGGIAGIACQSGFECKLDGDYPDAGGTCIKK